MFLCVGTGQAEEVARQQAGEYALRIQNKGGTARICRDGPAAAFDARQNWLRGPIALEQTPLRLTFASLMLAFAGMKPPCPRSPLAARLCTISRLAAGPHLTNEALGPLAPF